MADFGHNEKMISQLLLCSQSTAALALQKHWEPQFFPQSFDILYQGQVPNVAVFLVSGSVQLIESNEALIFEASVLLGVSELLDQRESSVGLRVLQGSHASIIDRTSLQQFMSLQQSFSKLIAV